MLRATPESFHERLPIANKTGNLILTADARLDNRDELISTLDLSDRPPEWISDGELILRAYEKWGTYCPEKLLGDFAFAVWDRGRQLLFCARDHFGVKPFYYYCSGRSFLFASEIKALLRLSEVRRRLNEERVGEYLAGMFDDKAATFYQDISRLPPAHSLLVRRAGKRLQSYWCLDPSREIHLGSDEAYAEAFRDIFVEAVRCRLRSAFPVGSSLSGGLDSSSVTCVAQQWLAQNRTPRLHTFSLIFDEVAQCDERPFIHRVLAQGEFEPHYIHGDRIGPLTDVHRILWHQDEPFYAPGLFLSWALFGAAREQGVRVLMDGHDGDGTVSHGHGRLDELAQARRWLTLAREAQGSAKVYGLSLWRLLWSYARYYELQPIISRSPALQQGWRLWQAVRQQASRWHKSSDIRPAWAALIHPEFVHRIGLADRFQVWQRNQPALAQGEREMHYRTLMAGLQPFALEVFDKAIAPFSIELRHPFWDKRLVEFCLALPSEQKLDHGWSRLVLRRAMAGIVPVKVQWRVDKSNFLPNFSHGLLAFEREQLEEIVLKDIEVATDYLDVPAIQELYHRFVLQRDRLSSREVLAMWRAISLVLWLRDYPWKGGELYGDREQEEGLPHA